MAPDGKTARSSGERPARAHRGGLGALIVPSVRLLAAALVLAPFTVAAESGVFNLHLEGGTAFALSGWQAEDLGTGGAGRGGVDLRVATWLGIEMSASVLAFPAGDPPTGYAGEGRAAAFYAALGVRLRPIDDREGYLLPWGSKASHAGNPWGNLWFGLDGGYVRTGDLSRFGCSLGFGYELSLVNALQIGPWVRAMWVPQPDSVNRRDSDDAWLLAVGLSVTFAVPPGIAEVPDSDGDGLYDPADRCPRAAEDADKFEDGDGCPDPDDDGDRIEDAADRCPRAAEDADRFEDEDGCPDPDNDHDGIDDAADRCPGAAEDVDRFEDEDGCPDPDNDGDGVRDASDRCPTEPETENGVEDEDGCPEADGDGDGVIDPLDGCPAEPESVNGLDDGDGCPDRALVEVRDREILGGERIFFDRGMARVKSGSKPFLAALARLLATHPEYEQILIQGHADATGDPAFNRALSRRRAERVRDYLIGLGIDAGRLLIEGAGAHSPWRRGRRPEELAKNRRVEFYLLRIEDDPYAAGPRAPAEVQP